ncbi:organic cation transporter protein-like [Patiria miniata]|uniref:Major facilitator superfamily (MFS) profile domain-containing protein n=1 Tax=Patiria miniata TaxID=46514 RepID=A0A914A323_PATMI|nr:organic cation transporter protein-like [Patiria miniata]
MHYEDILHHIGQFGKYQKWIIVLLSMVQIPTAFHFIAQVFLAANTDHWCVIPAGQAVNCSLLQLDSVSACQEAQKNQSIPYELDSQGCRVYSSCERYVFDDEEDGDQATNSTDVVACDAGWDFDRSRYKSTINEEFSLVCDREYLVGLAQSVWFAGVLTGSLVWGSVGDWLGRRKTLILSLTLVSISSIVTTFAPSFAAFTGLRFVTAACAYGAFLMSFVISTEIVGPNKRVLVGTVAAIHFAIGYVILSVFAYFIRDWRYLQLAISLPWLALFPLAILPESPRWLISKGRFKEAEKIITKIAKVNGTKVPDNLFENLENLQENERDPKPSSVHRTTFLDLFRTPNIRKKTLIIFFNWFVVNMVYYGLSLSTSSLGIDDYVAAFVSGALEVPALLLNWFVMEKFGRRFSLSALFVSGGVFCLISSFVPLGAGRVAVAMIGKFASTAAFNHVYIYSSELYPTVIRSIGMGASSMTARISGVLCPIILILGKYWQPLPLCVFGGSSVLAGMLSLMLPETLGCDMPDTIQDGEEAEMRPGLRLCCKKDLEDDIDSKPPQNYLPLSKTNKSPTEPVAI